MAKKWYIPLLFVIGITAAFEILLTIFHLPSFIFPKPSLVIRDLIANWKWILDNISVTVYEAVVGFALSIILGMSLSLIVMFVPKLDLLVFPMAVAVRNVPFVAIAPILFLVFGYGPLPKIIIVMIVSFFPIMANFTAGLGSVTQNQKERIFVLKATGWQTFTKLQLPASIPSLVTGLEVSVSNIVIAAIVGEILGTMKGLGHVIVMSVSQFQFPLLMAGVIVTTAVSIALTWVAKIIINLSLKSWIS
jgi:NitT/TauT family transport system permease protein